MTYHFGNRIYGSLGMGGRKKRKYAGVHNPKATDPVHSEFFIHNATFFKGSGFAGARWMVESGHILSDEVLEIVIRSHVRGGMYIHWIIWFEGRSVNYLPSVFDALN